VYRPADNYLKLTRVNDREVRNTVIPFRTHDRESCVEALSTALGLAQVNGGTLSVYDASPFAAMGESIPQIGDWHPDDLRDEPETLH
jgi:hypothetical protein